jgi:3-oxocholest-4-en-26-oate---CoA ligase
VSRWNFADVWEAVAETYPDAPALVQGSTRRNWRELDQRADALATALIQAGLGQQAKVAQYLYNSPEYLESIFASFKAGLVPVNTNYRYTESELEYLWDNADVEAVVFHATFLPRVEALRPRLPAIRSWLWVDDGSAPCPTWATPYEQAAGNPARGPVRGPWGRSPDDLFLVYTGGTTGLPKGVMWRQDDLFAILNRAAGVRYPGEGVSSEVRAALAAPRKHPPPRQLPAPPLMHGTGLFTALSTLSSAGTVVMSVSRRLDVEELLDLIQAEGVTELSIVGDAFAKPILAALDAHPGRWDISSLWLIISSGVMWSAEVKAGLLRHHPRLLMTDMLGSSEAVGMGSSVSRLGAAAATAGFQLGPDARVFAEDSREVVAGSGELGRLALRGRGPTGYYKDPDKTAATFQMIDGERWTIPGDFATVDEDGTARLLGRGSGCINTGGEKVFPEEVEEALKLHPAVADAVVVGTPDDRFGEVVTAVVEPRPGCEPLDEPALNGWVRARLAAYKAPRRVVAVDTVGRSPSGKVDYGRLRAYAVDALAATIRTARAAPVPATGPAGKAAAAGADGGSPG